ncbi:hypothetical protein COU62_04720 [Candidatus Pacearchaeota archaeon CG10_big_fil_rev_8_21_14_0_10_35_219]|nr:hypothetical protein [Candidatus Pacearchaeota archaeon]OIO42903.1 MAG: hypothetical protein AUJ63_01680 [Candidatus Pacearchaeota archaeon CG1_02_35_32]PIO07105.1 MAG: hypothetical protein COU62_04720 [Candidatus Pacearchaeota archaeon CG10_big_fil_rev_8_21_14_0_10_35_219]PIY81648.1 MAG: hypothetical protein COY79_01495 [Candidatus Pacearchaeota archaeon CG_4_10_14_0_8_um_filter_35_169]PIZ80900.1 MAG: hypothetical protein COY00_00075 [Candidatus Pacearchaeota archaeon CG_4_10_14_0_2_um_filt
MDKVRKIVLEIQNNYRNKLKTDKEIFYHLLEQTGRHIIKSGKLKESGEKEIFRREVVNMYLLSLGLIELERVDDDTIKASADYYNNKIKELFE